MDFLSQATGSGDARAEAMAGVAPIAEKFPCIAKVLMGQWNTDGSVFRTPGAVRIFTNGGRIKVQLSGQDWNYHGYVTLPEGELSLDVLEKLLLECKVDWSKSKTEKLASTNNPSY